ILPAGPLRFVTGALLTLPPLLVESCPLALQVGGRREAQFQRRGLEHLQGQPADELIKGPRGQMLTRAIRISIRQFFAHITRLSGATAVADPEAPATAATAEQAPQ